MLFVRLFVLSMVPVIANSAPVAIDSSAFSEKSEADKKYGVGYTSSVAQRPFVGVDDQSSSLLYLSMSYKGFYVEGVDFGYKLFNKNNYDLSFLITPRFYEVKEEFASNGELSGLDETERAFFAGISYQYRTAIVNYNLQLIKDVSESDGSEVNLSISKRFKLSDTFSITPSMGVSSQDSKLVDHFYGVQANEVVANRPLYSGKSSQNYNFLITAVWNVTPSFQLLGQIKRETLGDGITDSPVVDETSISSYVIGGVYRF